MNLGGGVKLVLVLIPPGTFEMGSPKDEKDRNLLEKEFDAEKQHRVTLTKPFYLGKYFYCIAPNRFGGKRLWFVLVMDDISVHAFKTFAFSVENRHRGPRRVCGPLLGWKTPLHNGRQEFLAANKLHRSINDTVVVCGDAGTV